MKTTVTVDIGTTRIKLGYFDAAGAQLASAKHPTPNMRDAWGVVYDIDAVLGLVDRFIRGLSADRRDQLERIAIAGVGESGGLVGPDLALHSPMILWFDQRGAPLLEALDATAHADIYRIAGLPVNANYALSKIAWALRHTDSAGDLLWLNVSEFLGATLTGERWSEYSLASRTMALDLSTRAWSGRLCDLVGIDESVLPPLRRAGDGQSIAADVARRLGVPSTVRVHVVGHDHLVGAVGADLRPGEILNSTGTTEGVLMLNDAPRTDAHAEHARLSNGMACDGHTYSLFASIPTGGSAFETLQGMLGMSASMLTTCVAAIADRYAGGEIDLARVPLVVPHFRGSPPPQKSAAARGLIAGLASDVRAEDVVLGCFLGLAIQFRQVLELFRTPATTIKVIGPAAANPLWLQLKADVLGRDLSVSTFPEVVSRGAQALASGSASEWLGCAPTLVAADPQRHEQLRSWHEGIQSTVRALRTLSW